MHSCLQVTEPSDKKALLRHMFSCMISWLYVCIRPRQMHGRTYYVPFRFVIWVWSYFINAHHLVMQVPEEALDRIAQVWKSCTCATCIYIIYIYNVFVQDQQTSLVLQNLASIVKKEEALMKNFLRDTCTHAWTNLKTCMACMFLLLQVQEKEEKAEETPVEESPRFIFTHAMVLWHVDHIQWRSCMFMYVNSWLGSSDLCMHTCTYQARRIGRSCSPKRRVWQVFQGKDLRTVPTKHRDVCRGSGPNSRAQQR